MFIDNLPKVLLLHVLHVLHTLLKVVPHALALSSLDLCTKRTDQYYHNDLVRWSFLYFAFLLIMS